MYQRTWIEGSRNELKALNFTYKIALNRTEWNRKIHVADPDNE